MLVVFLRLVPRRKSGMKSRAWMPPQTMKVQLAPCQNPETRKMTKTFRMALGLETRDPPRGM